MPSHLATPHSVVWSLYLQCFLLARLIDPSPFKGYCHKTFYDCYFKASYTKIQAINQSVQVRIHTDVSIQGLILDISGSSFSGGTSRYYVEYTANGVICKGWIGSEDIRTLDAP
ncbi:uncharacterized protein LAESUDRAFT_713477 [Laetiporus sulphureus 93-53]|uniref:Uncharacterized protein n=1 Tax=Laetiporus sulphureus 93-53 TaxID=1314785 RepID=A0A165EUW2_9APHY|nr:uncharacterized protein LAESUDRAFT_713477 [Laetiporus sulphureus 93-53]KZT07810.1 hypothetical protein LAESUDRAFT_713477 [Laetiporus sulphureus 93-53]